MNSHEKILHDRKIRDAAMDWLIATVTKNAQNHATIGKRVLIIEFILEREKGFPKMLTLAEKLGVSPARASQAVAAFQEKFNEQRNVNFSTLNDEKE